jgi:hypothetical protein
MEPATERLFDAIGAASVAAADALGEKNATCLKAAAVGRTLEEVCVRARAGVRVILPD